MHWRKMPLYEYKAETGEKILIKRSAKGQIPKTVTRKGIKYFRQYSIPGVIIDGAKPKTIGDLAQKNTEQMIKNGDSRVNTKPKKKPWWRSSEKPMNDLNKLTPKQQLDYIKTGKK